MRDTNPEGKTALSKPYEHTLITEFSTTTPTTERVIISGLRYPKWGLSVCAYYLLIKIIIIILDNKTPEPRVSSVVAFELSLNGDFDGIFVTDTRPGPYT